VRNHDPLTRRTRRSRLRLTAVLVPFLCMAFWPGAIAEAGTDGGAASPPPRTLAAYYEVPSRSSGDGKCLDVEGAHDYDGAWIDEWRCVGAGNQHWRLDFADYDGNYYYQLVGEWSQKCLDVYWGSTSPGYRTIIWSCSDSASQQWRVSYTDRNLGYFQLINRNSGLCLDVAAWGRVIQWTCHGGHNQQWRLR
jgi:Ricin-type beta-trefoil lectin domain-like